MNHFDFLLSRTNEAVRYLGNAAITIQVNTRNYYLPSYMLDLILF